MEWLNGEDVEESSRGLFQDIITQFI